MNAQFEIYSQPLVLRVFFSHVCVCERECVCICGFQLLQGSSPSITADPTSCRAYWCSTPPITRVGGKFKSSQKSLLQGRLNSWGEFTLQSASAACLPEACGLPLLSFFSFSCYGISTLYSIQWLNYSSYICAALGDCIFGIRFLAIKPENLC